MTSVCRHGLWTDSNEQTDPFARLGADLDEGAFVEFLIGWSRMLWVLSKATSMCKQQEQMVGYIVLCMTSDGNLEVSFLVRKTKGAEGGKCQFSSKV